MRLRINTVSVASAPIHGAAATVLIVAMAGIDKPVRSLETLTTKRVGHGDTPLLGIVHRHWVARRVVPGSQVNPRLAERSVL